MLTRFNDADEGNQLKGYQRQARNKGRLIGEGCACKSQLESSFSFDFYTIKGGYSTYLERATLKPILLLFSRFQFQRSLFSGQDRRNKKRTSHSGAGNSIAFKTARIRTDRTKEKRLLAKGSLSRPGGDDDVELTAEKDWAFRRAARWWWGT
ncbi:hypothetical protein L1987_87996 [Smallanthus sonchifolius]|nr:hypothetical protein L1987_87996 [Smallanthus sonchifolius]